MQVHFVVILKANMSNALEKDRNPAGSMPLVPESMATTRFSRSIKMAKRWAASKTASWFLLAILFYIVAAAAHSGFIGKWGLRDEWIAQEQSTPYSIESMLDGTAERPFVFRQMLPFLANLAESTAPAGLKAKLVANFKPSTVFAKTPSSTNPVYAFRYLVVVSLSFLAFFATLYFLRLIIIGVGGGEFEAILAPVAFMLAFPYIQTVGGYFYDGVELMFMCLGVLAAMHRQYIPLICLAAIATFNKESFFFFLLTLFPLLRAHLSRMKALMVLVPAILISGGINFFMKIAYSGNAGTAVQFHLWENLRWYAWPRFYFQIEQTYGIPGPRGVFFLVLIAAVLIGIRGWQGMTTHFKHFMLACCTINLPLFILFCARGELRNLSFLYVGFVLLLAFALKFYILDRMRLPYEAQTDHSR